MQKSKPKIKVQRKSTKKSEVHILMGSTIKSREKELPKQRLRLHEILTYSSAVNHKTAIIEEIMFLNTNYH